MVRTDSREQKLDAFLKPTNQNKLDNESANQKSASSANEQKLKTKESLMEIDEDENSEVTKKQG